MPKSKNPPTFRGSDFAMRYEQGRWAEDRILESIRASKDYWAFAYGRSGIGPSDKTKIAEYWEKYRQAESIGKRPDILVIRRSDFERLGNPETTLGDTTLATDEALQPYLEVAVCAIEAENSLWRARKMPDYGKTKLTKLSFVAPTVIVKKEDVPELLAWQKHFLIPICVVQTFFDTAYTLELATILEAVGTISATQITPTGLASLDQKNLKKAIETQQKTHGVFIKEQAFADARTGTSVRKTIYRAHYSIAREFGIVPEDQQPTPQASVLEEDNGKIMSYVRFTGGQLTLSTSTLELFDRLANRLG